MMIFALESLVYFTNVEAPSFTAYFIRGTLLLPGPRGFQEVEAPRFQDNRHMKVVGLSDLCTGRLYSQEIFLVPISVRG